MALEDTSLMREVEAITNQPELPRKLSWRAEILANEKIVVPLRVLSIDIRRIYDTSYGDEIFVKMIFGSGTFAHDIFPFKNNLKITLFREPLGEVSSTPDTAEDIESQVMTATLVDAESSVMEGNAAFLQNKDAADLTDLVERTFQLVDQSLEQIRMQSVGGVFRDTSTSEILKYLLTTVSEKIEVDDEHRIEGVDMYPPSNEQPQANIVIPHGTKFVDMPGYLHEKCSGIYNAGFGCYLQKKHWYVYPLYDLTRFESSVKGLTLINIPKNRMPGIERTFRKTANQVIALVTGDVLHRDDSESAQLNDGNGIRFADARMVFEGFGETKNNKTVALRATNNNEYMTEARDNKLNNVHVGPNRITSNTFVELSRMARRAGSTLQCMWENSDPGSIYPGMPVKYMYVVENQVVEVMGVVLGAHHFTGTHSPGLTSRRHITNTGLFLFVNRHLEWPSSEGEDS